MTMHDHTKILAFVGLAGSGKSTAVEYFTQKGYPKVYFGGVIFDAMREAGVDPTPANQQTFRQDYREKYGKDAVVNKIIEQINDLIEAGQHRIIADGLYSWTEYKALKHAFPGELTVVAIVTPKHLRYRRLANRPARPLTEVEANQRDWTEIENLEKGGPIAIADYYVTNDANLEELHQKLAEVAQQTEF